MTAPWEAPGLTPEERARALCSDYMPDTLAHITAAIRAAVAEERDGLRADFGILAGAFARVGVALGFDENVPNVDPPAVLCEAKEVVRRLAAAEAQVAELTAALKSARFGLATERNDHERTCRIYADMAAQCDRWQTEAAAALATVESLRTLNRESTDLALAEIGRLRRALGEIRALPDRMAGLGPPTLWRHEVLRVIDRTLAVPFTLEPQPTDKGDAECASQNHKGDDRTAVEPFTCSDCGRDFCARCEGGSEDERCDTCWCAAQPTDTADGEGET